MSGFNHIKQLHHVGVFILLTGVEGNPLYPYLPLQFTSTFLYIWVERCTVCHYATALSNIEVYLHALLTLLCHSIVQLELCNCFLMDA